MASTPSPSMPDLSAAARREPWRLLVAQAVASGVAVVVCLIVWAGTGGAFWPGMVILDLGLLLAIHAVIEACRVNPDARARGVTYSGGIGGSIAVMLLLEWALEGGGYPWWIWPWLGIGVAVGVHALVAYRDAWLPGHDRDALSARVDTLERTRRGALDMQAEQLRRIERDLHDGAQARLVALTMQLGRAEERLDDRPEEAALVRAAREEAGAAIAELRDLARGIAPPVLADRGLGAALDALGRRSAVAVEVDVALDERLAPVLESAVYFVVAEALTNVAKHAPGASAQVRVRRDGDRVVAEIADDGPGGAVPEGNGLTGIRHRVEALDGALSVDSARGRGTTVRAELPCAS